MKNFRIPRGAVEGVHYTIADGRIIPVVRGGDGPMGVVELEAKKLGLIKQVEDIAAKADDEGRELTAEERAEIMAKAKEARGVHDQILALDGAKNLRKELEGVHRDEPGSPAGTPGQGMTLGEKFTTSEQFRGWMKQFPNESLAGSKGRIGNSPPVAFGAKDLITGASDTSAGALVNSDRLGLLDGLGQFQRPLTLVDLVTRGTTGSDTVEYSRVTGFTNNASTVAEATTDAEIGSGSPAVTDAAAGLKPKSGLTLEKKTATVKTIAHWIPATKRSLSDAGQIRTLVDAFLRYGLDEELEDQVLLGDGTDENFDGILETSGIQSAAYDTDLLTTTRKARTLVRTVGRARPSAFVFHPNDNERIDLLKNSNGDFYFGGPTSNPSAPLWGLPRVECEAMPEGTGMVADWRMAVLWDREQATIQVSDSHADFFVRNLVAILAEMRAAFGVIRPKAFVTIDLTAGS